MSDTIFTHRGFYRNDQDIEWSFLTERRAYDDAKTDCICFVRDCERDGLGSYQWKIERVPLDWE